MTLLILNLISDSTCQPWYVYDYTREEKTTPFATGRRAFSVTTEVLSH